MYIIIYPILMTTIAVTQDKPSTSLSDYLISLLKSDHIIPLFKSPPLIILFTE